MIYFDNAATGGFKPRAVTDAVQTVIRYLSANPGRSGHRLSSTGAEMVYSCRKIFADTFSASADRVIFTKNCTEALNTAIFGTIKEGGHVITTTFEHNSVLRPLFALKERGIISLSIASPTDNLTLSQAIEKEISPNTYMIVATAVSNVTGEQIDIYEIGKIAKKHNLLFVVDGAQAGGHVNLDMKKNNISALALAGHKGLYGIMGSGVLIFDEQTDIDPLLYGGTGTESQNLSQPLFYPERLESGTLNLPAIASLNEGIRFVNKNLSGFAGHLINATEHLILSLSKLPKVKCYSVPNPSGIVAFSIDQLSSTDVADILSSRYDVAVRGGFHCAPLTHKFLGSEKEGLVRVSLAVQNSSSEIAHFIRAVSEITSSSLDAF
ncbi:MAG: aminotransferase class V-fold PLP-dependent enzyme [Clostridia bacterium]|nr:aminotransferase class V-fold PLP-dependent enzyme [Clostridia bacterium]